ncbi:MAG: N-acetylmuramoyl-L-alanine amidase, partial [Leptolyngbyaceae cyanobacterium]
LLRANALPINRYSIRRWEVTQLPQVPPVTRLALTLAPESPDWQVTTSNLGGIILVPPAGVSISSIPDQAPNPVASVPEPISVPDRPQPPSLPDRPLPPTELPQIPDGRFVVVLDPGHGGRDPGAVGIGGLQEKTIVLPVSLRVAELLRDAGVQVIMTRSDDRTLDLQPRVDIANQANATIFISIHANAISLSRPDVNGIETYYYSDSGRRLAETIHAAMLAVSGMNDRGVKQARFYVLRHTAMPASLLEIGFVTGQDDAPLLRDPVWRENMAQAIARGILQYLQQ